VGVGVRNEGLPSVYRYLLISAPDMGFVRRLEFVGFPQRLRNNCCTGVEEVPTPICRAWRERLAPAPEPPELLPRA
jgi:hypothetical protein